MTSPEDPAALADLRQHEATELLIACTRSVVYHLRQAIKNLHDETDREDLEEDRFKEASWKTKQKVKKAETQLWHCVQRFKWMLGDGTFDRVAWFRVKEMNPDGVEVFRWAMVDDAHHLRFLEEFLPIECERQHLRMSRSWLHSYESWGSGLSNPRVWAPGKLGWTDQPATYEEMSSRYQTVGRSIALCGPDAKPAEDVPAWLHTVATADEPQETTTRKRRRQTHGCHSPGRRHIHRVEGTFTGDVCHDVDPPDDPSAATAETAPPAEEAQPPARDEAEVDWGEAADEPWFREVRASASIGR